MIFCLVHTSSLLIFKYFFFLLSVFLYSLFVVLKVNNESNVQYISKNCYYAISIDLSFLCFVCFLFFFWVSLRVLHVNLENQQWHHNE